mgnify:CR=1 FL=1
MISNLLKGKISLFNISSVISILIIGIIGALSTRMLFQGAAIYFKQTDRQKLTSQSRSAFWRIQKDIRNQGNASNFNSSNSDTLILVDIENQSRKYCARDNGKLFMVRVNGSINLSTQREFSYMANVERVFNESKCWFD